MKFFHLITAFSLLLASGSSTPVPGEVDKRALPPVSEPETDYPGTEILDKRAPATAELQANYNKVIPLLGGTPPTLGKVYVFDLVWNLNSDPPNDEKYKALTQGIGGAHVGVLAGSFLANNQFQGNIYDSILTEDPPATNPTGQGLPVKSSPRAYLADSKHKDVNVTKYEKTTKKTLSKLNSIGIYCSLNTPVTRFVKSRSSC